jgi:hypothetical protein
VQNQAIHCSFHPQRLGIGICVECRKVICAECTTQFEGINRCAQCLAKLAPKLKPKAALAEWGAVSLLGAAASFAGLIGCMALVAAWLSP